MNPPPIPTLSTLAQAAAAPASPSPAAPADQALSALAAYDLGSSRAALLPLDEAVRAALANPDACRRLESRLLGLL
ncbi:MAG TPA: glycerol acyltransferase, partial [Candidatus Paceibacterota bacterium]|nr:glycerol acyltransferase [Candidatus Paceibacterota bacterium]